MFAIRPITALDFVIYIGSRSARLRLRPPFIWSGWGRWR